MLDLDTDQLDAVLMLAALCRGERHALDVFIDCLLEARTEAIA